MPVPLLELVQIPLEAQGTCLHISTSLVCSVVGDMAGVAHAIALVQAAGLGESQAGGGAKSAVPGGSNEEQRLPLQLATAHHNGQVNLWNAAGGRLEPLARIGLPTAPARSEP